jgi:hypothetical protein
MSDTFSATTSETRSQRGLVLRSGGSLQQPRHLFDAQDHWDFVRLAHEGEMSCHLGWSRVTVKKKRSAATEPLMLGARTPVCV